MTASKKELSPGGRAALGVVGLVQVVFAFLAFWEHAQREAHEVMGPNPVWIPAMLVNRIGPAS